MINSATLLAVIPLVAASDTCLTNPQFFGVIFGSVAAALLLCAAVAAGLWMCTARATPQKGQAKTAYTNTACEMAENGCTAKPSVKDQMTKIDSFKARNRALDVGTQKSFSTQNINEVDGKVGVQLNGEDLGGLGFNIQGNMTDGIFVKTVHPKGPAEQCGNILQGDRIKSLTISFENMVYEDAITLLSYASPYKVKLELERKLEDPPPETDGSGSPRVHPLFRSNTLSNVHFNPVGCAPLRSPSEATTQVHALPERPKSPVPVEEPPKEEVLTPIIEEIKPPVPEHKTPVVSEPDSTTGADADISKTSSSDDVTSSYRESLDDAGTGTESVASTEEISHMSQSTLADRIEISEVITDEIRESVSPISPKVEYCAALPPKPRKIVSRSPSPKMIMKTPTPPRAPSPAKKSESPKSTPSTPSTPELSNIPVRREPSRTRMTPPSPPRAPEITEARVSRIPKRSDSVKTPVLERKLPSIPHRSPSLEKKNDDDVWSRLYQEKKGALRKTREPTTSAATSPRISRTPSGDRYGTLSRDKRDRLAANQETLDRQTEELRRLGVL